MIVVKEGEVKVEGGREDIMVDFICVLVAMKNVLSKDGYKFTHKIAEEAEHDVLAINLNEMKKQLKKEGEDEDE